MKLLLIRHGEPNYEKDCLTEHGIEQAKQLAVRLRREKIDYAYTSPMGRAKQTAEICMSSTDIPLTVCDWLHEFDVRVFDKGAAKPVQIWDLAPENWTKIADAFDKDRFQNVPGIAGTEMYERYLTVRNGLDELLANHGLQREGGVYRKVADDDKTLALFCHFGVTCVMIAHLLGISPVLTLQGMSAEPTAIATVCTDDRFKDNMNFRLHGYGDINHLNDAKIGSINYK
ncbi:MAG: histidine phosphatase family protein [Ruminococcus sp.]|nr:histidine phosphatase family protein [Ruminococcus sp.]